MFIVIFYDSATAYTWYSVGFRYYPSDGVSADIFTPTQFHLAGSGISNWVSTFYIDDNGKDWLQAGWAYYLGYDKPKQYVEWCIDCIETQGTYFRKDEFAFHNWSSSVDYWVKRDSGSRWCAITDGLERFCVDNLHSQPVVTEAGSEIHDNPFNPLNTTFFNVRFKDTVTGNWQLWNETHFSPDFPYNYERLADYYFRTLREEPHLQFLPILLSQGN